MGYIYIPNRERFQSIIADKTVGEEWRDKEFLQPTNSGINMYCTVMQYMHY